MTFRITKGASDTTTARTPAYFYESARAGVLDLLVHGPTPHAESDGVLLPGYIGWSAREGSGVFDPIQHAKRPYGFYDLREDLSVDLMSLQRQLATGKFQYVVIIHYFGRFEPRMDEIRTRASEANVIVLDDLAHGFFTAKRSRAALDSASIELYSLHKQFPVDAGGMVVYRDAGLCVKQQSSMATLGATILSYDWDEIAESRRDNFQRIRDSLLQLQDELNLTLPWTELADGDVPQTLPVLLRGCSRDRVYADMNEQGFGMVSLYHTLIGDLREPSSTASRIAKSIINFPVHQDVVAEQIPAMLQAFSHAVIKNAESNS